MKNYGLRSNCSIAMLNPENVYLLGVDVGHRAELPMITKDTGLYAQVMVKCSHQPAETHLPTLKSPNSQNSFHERTPRIDVLGAWRFFPAEIKIFIRPPSSQRSEYCEGSNFENP